MDYFNNPENLKLLQNLLNTESEKGNLSDSELDERLPSAGVKFLPTKELKSSTNDEAKPSTSSLPNPNRRFCDPFKTQPQTLSEWEDEEAFLLSTELDKRPAPEYHIIYKQSLAPEEIYLQLGQKTPATASCEEMRLDVLMPDEIVDIDRMKLDVTSNDIDLQTPIYHLKLPLVQPIIPDRSKALWDKDHKILRLNLRMKREYDIINF